MDEKQIDDIVSMIDHFMAGSGGHMNVEVHDGAKTAAVTRMNSPDCAGGNLACCVPTLFEGLDADPDSDISK